MISKKVHLSLPEEEVAKFDMLRNELGMNRSQYFCYLLSGQKKQMPDSIRYKNLIAKLSDIDLHLKHICLKEGMDAGDVLYVHEAIKDLRTALNITFGPVDQKSKGGEKREKVKVEWEKAKGQYGLHEGNGWDGSAEETGGSCKIIC